VCSLAAFLMCWLPAGKNPYFESPQFGEGGDCIGVGVNVLGIDYCRLVGKCRTETSRNRVPLALDVAADLWVWRESTLYLTWTMGICQPSD
jgi:hypothetical protein